MKKLNTKDIKVTFKDLIVVIFSIWLLSILVILLIPVDMTTRGQIGDMFGGVNALFSGLALAGIIYTIFLQKEELKLQRKELQLTRDELKRSAAAQEKSEKTLEKTAKLNGLSTLLSNLNRQKDNMEGNEYVVEEISEYYDKYTEKLIEEINDLIK